MFSDPLVFTEGAVARNLPRISINGQMAKYRQSTGERSMTVSHQSTTKQRVRRMIRLDTTVTGSNPAVLEETVVKNVGIYLVIDQPSEATIDTPAGTYASLVEDFCTFLTENSSANMLKVLGSEI